MVATFFQKWNKILDHLNGHEVPCVLLMELFGAYAVCAAGGHESSRLQGSGLQGGRQKAARLRAAVRRAIGCMAQGSRA